MRRPNAALADTQEYGAPTDRSEPHRVGTQTTEPLLAPPLAPNGMPYTVEPPTLGVAGTITDVDPLKHAHRTAHASPHTADLTSPRTLGQSRASLHIPSHVDATIDLRAQAVTLVPHSSIDPLASARLVRDLASAGWVARAVSDVTTTRAHSGGTHAPTESPRHRCPLGRTRPLDHDGRDRDRDDTGH